MGNRRRVLLILQGMDACGKDGVISHVLRAVNPAGLQPASFTAPTQQELAHHSCGGSRNNSPDPA
jgi:polyphosphate kinase 2 (PPK2 family)